MCVWSEEKRRKAKMWEGKPGDILYFSGTNPRPAQVKEQVPAAGEGEDSALAERQHRALQTLLSPYCHSRYLWWSRKMSHTQNPLVRLRPGRCLSLRRLHHSPSPVDDVVLARLHQHWLVWSRIRKAHPKAPASISCSLRRRLLQNSQHLFPTFADSSTA